MVRFSFRAAIISLWLLFAIVCNLVICDLKVHCNQKDRQILLCFRHGLIDPSGMLSTWSSEEDCCHWRGVQCDITGRVTNLSLPCSTGVSDYSGNVDKKHCLAGEFHLSLLELEFLNYLDLSNNNFKAMHLPLDCQNLSLVNSPHGSENSSNLVYLDLSKNQNLVIEDLRWLPRLSSLKYLNLSFIDLHKETQWLQILTTLPSLSELNLRSCLLESISASLDYANLSSLQYLDLSHNNFHFELPNWLFNLSGLSYLFLHANYFRGQIPNTLLNLQNLYLLKLDENMLNGTIPDWLGQLGSLQYLDLSENLFTGPIPTTVGNLSSLRTLDVASNHLNGSLPEILGQLSNLESLSVFENFLTGAVSHRNFAKLSKLRKLWLGSPSMMFEFDPHWIPPFILDELTLIYAYPTLPSWIYTQTSLSQLEIDSSTFALESPDKFWNWAIDIPEVLYLFNNSMDWDMSNVLLNSRFVWLVSNNLRGSLPRLTPNVTILEMEDNFLSGPISPLLCHKMNGKSNLQYLVLGQNFLSGGLTDCWESWKSLAHVDLSNNNLTGTIPHSMSSLSNLISLYLGNNNLYGEIPLSLQNCQNLKILNLGENKFSGSLPNLMGHNVIALLLRSNQFSGEIPLQICQLSSLIVLDFANNRLSGTIPHCLQNITAMAIDNTSEGEGYTFYITDKASHTIFVFRLTLLSKGNELNYERYVHVIDFSSNNLSGTIPSEVFRLTGLQSLNLSRNQLRGTIPEEIGNLKQLESLDLSMNKLSGEIPQTMSALTFLGFLNFSFNNFKGPIPSGTQLQGFTALSYIGNPELCGFPISKNCTQDEAVNYTKPMEEDEEDSKLLKWFYTGMAVGFAVSFWVVCGFIFFNRTCRHAYFKFLDDMKDRLYVKMVLKCTPSVDI